ncbi:MAG: hypothetical protein ACLFVU_05970 [Phycisphaerae bacterium]
MAKTIRELQEELKAKQAKVGKLQAKRDKFLNEISKLDSQIEKITGEKPSSAGTSTRRTGKTRRSRRGPAGGKTLTDYLEQVLKDHPEGMRAKEAEQAVLDAGYPTTSKSFYNIVATTLREGKQFEKVSRGVYKLK